MPAVTSQFKPKDDTNVIRGRTLAALEFFGRLLVLLMPRSLDSLWSGGFLCHVVNLMKMLALFLPLCQIEK